MTPTNITSGVIATGISPLNPDIFTNDFVTDRPGRNVTQ
jgi:hypothetical protein